MRMLLKLFLVAIVVFAAFLTLTVYVPKPVIEKDGGYRLKFKVFSQNAPQELNADDRDSKRLKKIIDKRLRDLGYRHTVIEVGPITEVAVPLAKEEDLDLLRGSLERAGKLSFRLVVDESSGMEPDEIEKEILALYSRKKDNKRRSKSNYDLVLDVQKLDRESQEKSSVNLKNAAQFHLLVEKPGLSGEVVRNSYKTKDSMGRPAIGLDFSMTGSRKVYALTSKNLRRKMAIILDGDVLQTMVIQAPITEKAVVSGFSVASEISSIAAALNGGTYPSGFRLQQQAAVFVPKTESSGRKRFIAIVVAGALLSIIIILLFPKRKTDDDDH